LDNKFPQDGLGGKSVGRDRQSEHQDENKINSERRYERDDGRSMGSRKRRAMVEKMKEIMIPNL
jgi:hypothetical protein